MSNNTTLIKEFNGKVEKFFGSADLATGGALEPNHAKKFFEQIKKKSDFLSKTRIEIINENTLRLDTLEFQTDVLKVPDAEGTELAIAKKAKPTTGQTEIVLKEIKAQADFSYQAMMDLIEDENSFKTRITKMLSDKIAAETQILALKGVQQAIPVNPEDLFNGFIELAQGGHLEDAVNSNIVSIDATGNVDQTLLKRLYTYGLDWGISDKPDDWWILAHPLVALDYVDTHGKKAITANDIVSYEKFSKYMGVQIAPIAGMPSYIQPYANTFPGGNNSSILLAEKKNMVTAFQRRNVIMKTWDNPLTGLYSLVVWFRMGVGYINRNRTAVMNNVKHG